MPGIIRNVAGARTLGEIRAVGELILLALLVNNSLPIKPVVHPCNRPACIYKQMQFVTIDGKLMQTTNQRSLLAERIVQIMEDMADQAETALVSDLIVL